MCVAVAHAAFHADEPEVALFALGAVSDVGQRTAGAFGWRRWLDEQLLPLVDEERAAVLAEGAGLSPAMPSVSRCGDSDRLEGVG